MRLTPRRPHGDDGTTFILALLFIMIAILFMMGVTASAAAFVAHQELQSDCDGAALAAASEADSGSYGKGTATENKPIQLSDSAAQQLVNEYNGSLSNPDLATMTASVKTDGEITVVCDRTVDIPFAGAFGRTDGVDRHAESTARAPVQS
ncbi:MAG: hypothetical protein HOQ05_04670 [Corynebacteriales bacterium]|nr:hypothetical protein [Mycobacteriales bacterium]